VLRRIENQVRHATIAVAIALACDCKMKKEKPERKKTLGSRKQPGEKLLRLHYWIIGK